MLRTAALAVLVGLLGCGPAPVMDAGMEIDAGVEKDAAAPGDFRADGAGNDIA